MHCAILAWRNNLTTSLVLMALLNKLGMQPMISANKSKNLYNHAAMSAKMPEPLCSESQFAALSPSKSLPSATLRKTSATWSTLRAMVRNNSE